MSNSNTPPWVKWGVIGFLAFIFLINSQSQDGKPSQLISAVDSISKEFPDTEDYTKLIPKNTKLSMEVLEEGNGDFVLCGQDMQVDYVAYNQKQKVASGSINMHQMPGADAPLALSFSTGVRLGEKRRLTAEEPGPLTKWIEGKEEGIVTHFDLSFVSARPDSAGLFNAKGLGIKLFDEKPGTGNLAACGEEVEVSYRAFNASSRLIGEDTLSFKIGAGQVIAGLEQGVIGMQIGASRTIILPSVWQKHLYKHSSPYRKLKEGRKPADGTGSGT